MIYLLICIISTILGFLLFRYYQRKRNMPFIYHWLFEMSMKERRIEWEKICKERSDFWVHEFATKSDEELEKEYLILTIRLDKGKVK